MIHVGNFVISLVDNFPISYKSKNDKALEISNYLLDEYNEVRGTCSSELARLSAEKQTKKHFEQEAKEANILALSWI